MRDLLPGDILDRPKQGFGVPVGRWLKHELRSWVNDLLGTERLKREGFFDPAVVSRMVAEHTTGKRDHRKRLWTLLVFQGWLDRWGH
jgi:asparagine synthase (glutamine-hydrolysing)